MGRLECAIAVCLLLGCNGEPVKDKPGGGPEARNISEDVSIIFDPDTGVEEDIPSYHETVGETRWDGTLKEFGPQCAAGEGCFLDPCDENSDCQAGWCVDHMGDSVCTIDCVEECPDGWLCEQIGTGPDVGYFCISPYTHLCRPCQTSADCKAATGVEDVCLVLGPQGSFCGADCSESEVCPGGYSCVEAVTAERGAVTQCVPDSGECKCTDKAVSLGLGAACHTENEFGVCAGLRTCSADGLGECDAPVAAMELCNGVDDDCSGEVDDGEFVDGAFANLCDDGNDCTEDSCGGEAGCSWQPLAEGECQDGDPCTIADLCVSGLCLSGGNLNCDDNNICTDDWCNPMEGCVNDANQVACDDGDACTMGDTCSGGECIGGGEAPGCDDANVCTSDDCDAQSGCTHEVIPGCCNDNVECADGDACTNDVCVANGCKNTFMPGCCKANGDCDDGDFCTEDTCQNNVCFNAPIPDCCKVDLECSDGNACTSDKCIANLCKNSSIAGCCKTNQDCLDDDPCTEDVCQGENCLNKIVLGCCKTNLACDDGNPCTGDSCQGNLCQHDVIPECCINDVACNDNDACTLDKCIASHCEHGDIQGCCKFPADCNDADACTDDLCIANACQNQAVPDCCSNDGQCDDFDPCTHSVCVGYHCQTEPISGCCKFNSDCDDDNVCTVDTCKANKCLHTGVEACCTTDKDCDDNDTCTEDACVGKMCKYATTQDCCVTDVDCHDGDVCTEDTCVANLCLNDVVPGCCLQDSDCGDGDPCTIDSCEILIGVCQFEETDCCETNAECDDGNLCTLDECVDGGCVSGKIGTCVILKSTQDVWLEGNGNHNGPDFLIIGKTGQFPVKRSLLQFDTTQIPSNAAVLSARLRVYHHYASVPGWLADQEKGIDRTVEVYRLLVTWQASHATAVKRQSNAYWNVNMVGLDGVDAETEPLDSRLWVYDELGWKEFDVTGAAQEWVNIPSSNRGVVMRATNEQISGRDRRFYSQEAANQSLRPELVVIYGPGVEDEE